MSPEPAEPATIPPDADWRTGSGSGMPRVPGTMLVGVVVGCCGADGLEGGGKEGEGGAEVEGFGRRKRSARCVDSEEEDGGEWG